MPTSPAVSSSRLGGLAADLSAAIRQQMVFWGQDVVHPQGNLFLPQGFSRTASTGLTGTSCYRREWQGGTIELHGAFAGWFSADGADGFIFIRPLGRCYVWRGGAAPVPGEWPAEHLGGTDFPALFSCARPFLEWWMQSERWIHDLLGPSYRAACHRHVRRLPKGKPWLAPERAMRWVALLAEDPAATPRAKRLAAVR